MSNWRSDFGHAATGSGAKNRGLLRRKIFCALILKQSERTVFEQKFVFSLVAVCSHASISLYFLLFFYCFFFSIFWIGFFLNAFSNPFIVHYRPSFLFEANLHFWLVLFCSDAAF